MLENKGNRIKKKNPMKKAKDEEEIDDDVGHVACLPLSSVNFSLKQF